VAGGPGRDGCLQRSVRSGRNPFIELEPATNDVDFRAGSTTSHAGALRVAATDRDVTTVRRRRPTYPDYQPASDDRDNAALVEVQRVDDDEQPMGEPEIVRVKTLRITS